MHNQTAEWISTKVFRQILGCLLRFITPNIHNYHPWLENLPSLKIFFLNGTVVEVQVSQYESQCFIPGLGLFSSYFSAYFHSFFLQLPIFILCFLPSFIFFSFFTVFFPLIFCHCTLENLFVSDSVGT